MQIVLRHWVVVDEPIMLHCNEKKKKEEKKKKNRAKNGGKKGRKNAFRPWRVSRFITAS